MSKQHELTAGQIWGLKQMFAQTSAMNDIDLSRRMSLIRMLDFTAEEREQIEFMELSGPPGMEDQTDFNRDVTLTRRLTAGQRKKLLDTCRAAMPRVMPSFFNTYVYPAMVILGYKLLDPGWEEDEDEDEM